MADNYTQFAFSIPFTKVQSEFAADLLDQLFDFCVDGESNGDLADAVGITEDSSMDGIEYCVEQDGTLRVWTTDEVGDVEGTVLGLQYVLRHFNMPTRVGFSWADTCSKPRLGEFGGGAVVFTGTTIEWLNVYSWLEEKMNAVEGLDEAVPGLT
jgi:hypothetical protein